MILKSCPIFCYYIERHTCQLQINIPAWNMAAKLSHGKTHKKHQAFMANCCYFRDFSIPKKNVCDGFFSQQF